MAENYTLTPAAPEIRKLVVPAELGGMRLDQALARLMTEHSRSRLQRWVREGRVTIDGRDASVTAKVWGGETLYVEMQPDAAEAPAAPEEIFLPVIHEDDSIVIIDKPAGLVVHPGSGNRSGTMLNALLKHAPQLANLPRAGIVHRLDKDTSGLLVVAKTPSAQTSLVRQLQARTVGRHYMALVHGEVANAGAVEAPIGRHPTLRTRMAVVAGGKPASTHYRPLEHQARWSLVECRLQTGRTHQIRVHLSSIGHPLIGDPVYRSRRAPAALPPLAATFSRQALHAARLELLHPRSGEALHWESPLPADLRELLEALRNG